MNLTYKYMLSPKPNRQGMHGVLLRLTLAKKHRYVNMGFFIYASQFSSRFHDGKGGVKKHKSMDEFKVASLNGILSSTLSRVGHFLLWARKNGDLPTLQDVVSHLSAKEQETQSALNVVVPLPLFFAWAYGYLEKRYQAGELAYDTYRQQRTVLNLFKDHTGGKDFPFAHLSASLLLTYKASRIKAGISINTISGNLKKLKYFVKIAIRQGLLEEKQNPFREIVLKYKKRKKTPLSLEELSLLETVELPIRSRMNDARNIFLFCYYLAGIRIADALQLKIENISGGRLHYHMNKTSHDVSLALSAKATAIYNFYKEVRDRKDFLFPFLSMDVDYSDNEFLMKQLSAKTSLVNKFLKLAARKAGIERWQSVSSHIARHSFASHSLLIGGDLYATSSALRHSSLQQTTEYLNIKQKVVDDLLKKMEG